MNIPIINICVYFMLLLRPFTTRAFLIEDCCSKCNSQNFDEFNEKYLNKKMKQLRERTFFRIFQVNMNKKCVHLAEGTCASEKCQISECCDDDIPAPWKAATKQEEDASRVETETGGVEFESWKDEKKLQWLDVEAERDSIYVDLLRNEDGWTGYGGKEAGMVWKKIYECNVFKDKDKDTKEGRLLYRLISGFHTLTTCKVFANMPLGDGVWGPNIELYEKVVHPQKEWLNNLYFNFVILLRAVNKFRVPLSEFWYHTGNPYDDNHTVHNIFDLLYHDFLESACSSSDSFDETMLFRDENATRIDDFRSAVREISQVLDCVGCEKCKLHAKLEFLGLGTAVKILFSQDATFERNEIIALMNTLGKYSDVLMFVRDMQQAIDMKIKNNENTEEPSFKTEL